MSDYAALAIDGEAWTVIHRTLAAGHYDEGGRWVKGANVDTPILAAVFPATGRQLEDVPEGIRSEARMLLWSRSRVSENDTIIDDGTSYRVLTVWNRFREGGFYKAALGKVA